MSNAKLIDTLEYHGFESLSDLERDIWEAVDERYNKNAKIIPGEFQGTVKITIEYIPSEDEQDGRET